MKLFRRDGGFSLVELMVVVLIIGILVAIAIPVFNAAKANAQRRSCYANQRTIDGASESFYAETGAWPADVAALTGANPPYLRAAPACPLTGNGYTIAADGTCNACADASHGSYQ
jgi:prepilin-type N-terminal cleavage/methylation domain-containing protein